MNAVLTLRAMIEAEVTRADRFPRMLCSRGVLKMELMQIFPFHADLSLNIMQKRQDAIFSLSW